MSDIGHGFMRRTANSKIGRRRFARINAELHLIIRLII